MGMEWEWRSNGTPNPKPIQIKSECRGAKLFRLLVTKMLNVVNRTSQLSLRRRWNHL